MPEAPAERLASAAWVSRFWQGERSAPVPTASGAIRLAAVGTIAPRAVASPRLAGVFGAVGVTLAASEALDGPDELFARPDWQLALVLSPFKQQVASHCQELGPSATASGVVDTVIRANGRNVGLNTNTWAAQAALRALVGGDQVGEAVVLGTGSSTRSVVMALRREWPKAHVAILGRRPQEVARLAGACGVEAWSAGRPRPRVVVNTTTYGETDESEQAPFSLDLEAVLGPGTGYFDLNNRVGALPRLALAWGCTVMTGTFMQLTTDAIRASLAQGALDAAR